MSISDVFCGRTSFARKSHSNCWWAQYKCNRILPVRVGSTGPHDRLWVFILRILFSADANTDSPYHW